MESVQEHGSEPKVKIFISYSRKDIAFVDRLETELNRRGFEPLIDRTEIYAFEDWWKRIEALIGKADTVVFVVSPDAVTSEVSLKEVAYAASLNKRFAPIVYRMVAEAQVPEVLRRLHFIFFDDSTHFEARADQLAEALRTNIGWIRKHTEFGQRARDWSAAGRPSGLLLRSPVLEEAERWIASRPRGAPAPIADTEVLVVESRQGVTRRRNILSGSLAAGLFLALVLVGLAYWQRGIAIEQRDTAVRNQSAALAAISDAVVGTDQARAVKLALAAWPRRNGDGVQQLDRALAALSTAIVQSHERKILRGHEDSLSSAAFSPDGTRIVTASRDKTARLWDVETGQEIAVMRGHEDSVWNASFSPDGTRIVTASGDKTARLWDGATGKEIAVLRGHDDGVRRAAFSPDGRRIVTASFDKTARLWDVETGKEIAVLRGHDSGVRSAAFSPDGARIVTASQDATARLWDGATAKEIAVLRGPLQVETAAFSPDGTRIVTASADVRLWDVETGQEIAVLRGHERGVSSAAFSPNGARIVTASADKTVRLWDLASRQEIAVLRGHESAVWSAAFSSDGTRIVTASQDKTAGYGMRRAVR
jgi:Tol biopolymer transport system component